MNNNESNDLANHLKDESDEYVNNLVNEAHELFKDTISDDTKTNLGKLLDNKPSTIEKVVTGDDENEVFVKDEVEDVSEDIDYEEKPLFKIRLNKGLLALGVCMMVCTLIITHIKGEKHYANLPDYDDYSGVEAVSNTGDDSNNTAVILDESSESIGDIDIDFNYNESGKDDVLDEEHLVNIPVKVTAEVDSYFKDCVKYLKIALSVDKFLASNNTYQNQDLINALQLMVTDYEESVSKWNEHNIPDGCEEFDELIVKSLNAYQYYFNEVIDASNLETVEEYRNKLNASVAYVQNSVSNYTNVSQEFSPVFYYYGLYT